MLFSEHLCLTNVRCAKCEKTMKVLLACIISVLSIHIHVWFLIASFSVQSFLVHINCFMDYIDIITKISLKSFQKDLQFHTASELQKYIKSSQRNTVSLIILPKPNTGTMPLMKARQPYVTAVLTVYILQLLFHFFKIFLHYILLHFQPHSFFKIVEHERALTAMLHCRRAQRHWKASARGKEVHMDQKRGQR